MNTTGVLPGSLWFARSDAPATKSKFKWLLESVALWCTKESREAVGLTYEEGEDIPAKNPAFNGGIFQVNMEWVAEQKRRFKGDGTTSWISTNDIITSWFLTKSKASMGAMAVNARNRTPELGTNLAGNYQLGFLLHPNEFSSPSAIPKSVTAFSASTQPDSTTGPGNKLALISSWT